MHKSVCAPCEKYVAEWKTWIEVQGPKPTWRGEVYETAANLEMRTRRARIGIITLRVVGRCPDTWLHQAKGVACVAAVTMKPPGILSTLFGLQLEAD